MRIEEVYGYQNPNVVMEAPYGAFQRMKDKATSKVKGLGGGGQREKGNIQAGEKANRLYKGLKTYIGRVLGPGSKEIEGKYLINFLQGQKLDVSELDAGAVYNPKEAQQAIMKVIRTSMMYDEPAGSAPAQQSPAKAQPKAPAQEPVAKPEAVQSKAPLNNEFASLSDEERNQLLQLL